MSTTPHATRADLEARFGVEEIARLADGTDAAGEVGRVELALADALAYVVAALAPVYTLPLPAVNVPLLTGVLCDLARARLYDDRVPEAVSTRVDSARKTLELLVSGTLVLTDADGRALARRRAASPTLRGPGPVMSADTLAGRFER